MFLPRFQTTLARLRQRLTSSRDALALALLGLLVGIGAAIVSIAFRGAIELVQFALAPNGAFEALTPVARFLLPVLGVAITVAALYLVARGPVATGVAHVRERLAQPALHLPVRNMAVQFLVGVSILGFGMSMGREGPAIHLGATSGTVVGRRFGASDRVLRTLVGCGVASAIGAAFNTPLAGVVIAVEIVLLEYTAGGFTPILLAAVSGATLGRIVYGDAPAFAVPAIRFGSLWELPWVAAMGIALGAYSAAFIALTRFVMRVLHGRPWWAAMLVAGVAVGAIATFVPQVMGVGYDVVEHALKGNFSLTVLASIAACKLVATAAGAGARIPAGLIGPTLVMGAAFGGVFGTVGSGLVTTGTSNVALYAMLGMAGMMAATLNAPLSALVAVLELTGNPHVILPGILAVMLATLTARHVFECEAIFDLQLRPVNRD